MLTRLNTLHPPPHDVFTLLCNYFFVSKNVRGWNQHVQTYLTSCNIFLVTCSVRLLPWIALHSVEIYVNASYLLARWLGRYLESGCQRTKRFCTTYGSILSAPSFYKYIGHLIVCKGSIGESFCIMLLCVKPLRVTQMRRPLKYICPITRVHPVLHSFGILLSVDW